MRAVLCESFGPPENLAVRDLPDPSPGPGEVRIRTKAAGVNFPDTLIIQNLYQIKPPMPFTPGSELSGIVEEVGADVTDFKPGDRVEAITQFGAFSEQVVTAAANCLKIPEGMPFDVAAAFGLVYGTSYHALTQRAALQPGETLLVLGAAGGVGLTAVELGKLMGARVIACASSDEKLALARDYGADEVINYSTQDFRAAVKELAGSRGIDVVYDPVGGALAETAFRALTWKGRYLVIGFAAGEIPAIPLNLPLVKGASIVGVFWGTFTAKETATHRENMDTLYRWYEAGKLKPYISRRFPLLDASAAIRWVMDRKAQGKVVLVAE